MSEIRFLQLIYKALLIFKPNLEQALSVLKERESYESKHVAVECRCLKIRDLLSYETGKIIIKSTYGWNNQTKFRCVSKIPYL